MAEMMGAKLHHMMLNMRAFKSYERQSKFDLHFLDLFLIASLKDRGYTPPARDDVDIAIRHGDGNWLGLDVQRLYSERLTLQQPDKGKVCHFFL